MKTSAKQLISFLIAFFGSVMAAAAQGQPNPPPPGGNYDPFLEEGFVTPAPLLPVEFGGTGQVGFKIGSLGGDDIPWVIGDPMKVVITLSRGVPDVNDPLDPLDALNALSGAGAAQFSWSYNTATRTFEGSQIATIIGNTSELIAIDYRVAENSYLPFQNGFNANLTPPTWIASQPSAQPTDNDQVANLTFVRAFDYGDAPSTYGTPNHEVDNRRTNGLYNRFVYLGTHIDADDASQPSLDATGDDVNDDSGLFGVIANDEDGIVFPGNMLPGETYQIPVSFTLWDYDFVDNDVAVRFGFWIDWDQNGAFALSGNELIQFGANLTTDVVQAELFAVPEFGYTGPRTFTFNVPVTVPLTAQPGNYIARLRIGPNTFPTGNAAYGEVEDHQFEVQELVGSISGTVGADTTGDGSPDTVVAGVLLTLLDENGDVVLVGGNPVTTVTDTNGFYIFENVPPGNYQVAKTPSGTYVSLSDADGGNPDLIGSDTLIAVVGNVENENNDFLEFLQKCPDTWADWQAKWDTDLGGQTGLTQNPDGDRYSNLIEYAFCLPPNVGVRKPFCLTPSISVTGAIDGVYTRTAIGGAKDVTYVLEWAASISSTTTWTGIVLDDADLVIVNDGEGGEEVTIPDIETFTLLNGGSGFVRIRVNFDDGVNPPATDTTDVLGWVQTDFDTCCTTYCNPFLECAVFTGTVDSVSGQDLVLTTSANGLDLGTVLEAGVAYYMEVETGTLAGNRFDIASGGVDSLTLPADSDLFALTAPHNTIAGAAPAALAGSRIAIHRAKTLNMLYPPTGFNAGAIRADSDEVQVFAGGQWKIYWLFDDAGTARWVDAADANNVDQGDTVIPPGRGMYLNNRGLNVIPVLAFGEVREQPFANPLDAGNNLVSGGYPVDQIPVGTGSRELNLEDGFFGSRDFKTADSIFRWRADGNPSSSGYDTYFLLSFGTTGDEKWVLQNDAFRASQDTTVIFERDRSVFQRVKDGFDGYLIPAPWAPDAP